MGVMPKDVAFRLGCETAVGGDPMHALSLRYAGLIALTLFIALPATAVPTTVTVTGQGPCDPLVVPPTVEELGNPSSPPFGPAGAFPADEAIASISVEGVLVACFYNGGGIREVSITNLTTTAFDNLWYVANPGTSFQNIDGYINGMPALKIDAVGNHWPLRAESAVSDGIFAPGERWSFLIMGYANADGCSSALLGAIGVPSSAGGCASDGSSGSIIATPIPEPTTAGLVGLGLLGLAGAGRRAYARVGRGSAFGLCVAYGAPGSPVPAVR
jgi:hypothetical protein